MIIMQEKYIECIYFAKDGENERKHEFFIEITHCFRFFHLRAHLLESKKQPSRVELDELYRLG